MKAVLKDSGKEVEITSIKIMVSELNDRNQIEVTYKECSPDQLQFYDYETLNKIGTESGYIIYGILSEYFSKLKDIVPKEFSDMYKEVYNKHFLKK